MNVVVDKSLSASDKFMPEMHLEQPGPFTKNKERIQKLKETGDKSYIYKK